MAAVETFETSSMLARPIELYIFNVGGEEFRFTSRRRNYIAVDGNEFRSERISRAKIKRTNDYRDQNIDLEVPHDFLISQKFKDAKPGTPIDLQIFRTHKGATSNDFLWSGRVVSCSFSQKSSILECQSHGAIVEKYAVRKSYQRACSNDLYGSGCKVIKSLFTSTLTASSISENGLTISSDDFTQEAGFFVGGFIEVNNVFRAIIQYNPIEKFIIITAPIDGFTAGDQFNAAAGCDKNLSTCTNRFNNAINFLGFIHIPKENPFEKDLS